VLLPAVAVERGVEGSVRVEAQETELATCSVDLACEHDLVPVGLTAVADE
jgi:hypothetical protein